ncbi:hypothetical protein CGLO_16567 [Colletotrichum gloeosporioides Cg-14]|uniref:Uncharacterized protein n=1 Tax=Colletotrichum gloeosporioides (strain Cg-14) TaxID=1237896 RepID=T0JYS6_COLGC|nr:hypothetical protein CGLO_16567 [Colletotrichum gloeosporioides Cg-14]
MPEPWQIQHRLKTLLRWAEDPSSGGGIGPSIDSSSTAKIINDRWPSFEGTWQHETQDDVKNGNQSGSQDDTRSKIQRRISFKLQYIASQGTIYQRFLFSYHDDHVNPSYAPELKISPNLLIRNLDFVNMINKFNQAVSDDDSYTSRKGTDCLVREHIDDTMKSVLHIHILDKKNSAEFVEAHDFKEKATHYTIRPMIATKQTTSSNEQSLETVSIILAYTLDRCAKAETTKILASKWETISATMDELFVEHHKHSLTNFLDPTLDFFLGRNLEYILSVCSIPIPDLENKDIPYVALTCGDVESHRVTTPASFYAFQFLLLALKYFDRWKPNTEDCNCPSNCSGRWGVTMQARVRRVCSGHMKWVMQATKGSGTLHCPDYWINGDRIDGGKEDLGVAHGPFANASFQIIKACGFRGTVEGQNTVISPLSDGLRKLIENWLEELDKINKHGLYAFPRYGSEKKETFYLRDHALIWLAIKSTEMAYPWQKLRRPASDIPYSSQILRHHMIKRFTTENPQSQSRMIAVTRSLTQTGFLLEPKDIAVFFAMDSGFFDVGHATRRSLDGQRKNQFWTNTLDCQKDHEDNDDFGSWGDPLQLALTIIVARQQNLTNWQSEDEMYEEAMSVLLGGSSSNGLFPGWMGHESSAAIYDSQEFRDRYWEVTFIIPCLLWKYCHKAIWDTTPASGAKQTPATKHDTSLILDEHKEGSAASHDETNSAF